MNSDKYNINISALRNGKNDRLDHAFTSQSNEDAEKYFNTYFTEYKNKVRPDYCEVILSRQTYGGYKDYMLLLKRIFRS